MGQVNLIKSNLNFASTGQTGMEPDSSVTSKFPVFLFSTNLPITICLSTFDASKKDFDDSVEKSYWSGELGFSYRCLRFWSWARCRSSNICLSEWIERKYFSDDDKAPFRFRFSDVLKLKKMFIVNNGGLSNSRTIQRKENRSEIRKNLISGLFEG